MLSHTKRMVLIQHYCLYQSAYGFGKKDSKTIADDYAYVCALHLV